MVVVVALACPCAFAQSEGSSAEPLTRLVLGYSEQVFFDVEVNDARAATKVWAEHFVRQKYPEAQVETVIIPDPVSLEAALQSRQVDLFGVTALEYVELRDRLRLEGVLMTEGLRGPYEQFLVLARKDVEFHKVADLRGKRGVTEGSLGGLTPMLWIESMLREEGLPHAEVFFGKVATCSKPRSVVLPVFFRQADFCVVSASSFETLTELNPQIGKELCVFRTSPGFASGVICFRNDLNTQHKGELRKIMLEMDKDPRGQQLLTLFRVKKLVPFDHRYLESIEDLVRGRGAPTRGEERERNDTGRGRQER